MGELNYSGIAYDQYIFGYRLETREVVLAYYRWAIKADGAKKKNKAQARACADNYYNKSI